MKIKKYELKKQSFIGIECKPDGYQDDMQKYSNEQVISIAKDLNVPLLLTLDSHFVKPSDKFRQDIVLMSSIRPWKFYNSYHIQTREEAWENWKNSHGCSPEASGHFVEALENNQAVVDMIEPFCFPKSFHMKTPEIPIHIQETESDEYKQIERYVIELIARHGRLPKDERADIYIRRLKEELRVIGKNPSINFLPYFLVLHDVCEYARDQKIMMGPGRGSAAGSLLSYLLKITHLDPVKFGLSFPRFLSLGRIARGKFPDIDLDFGDPKRIVTWMKEKHGDSFARICTTGTMKLKGAIKDISRALLDTKNNEEAMERVEAVCKSLPISQTKADSKEYLYGWTNEEGTHPGMIDVSPDLAKFLEDYPLIKDGLNGVLDIPRSIGRHASAYCLSDVPIGDLVPMCNIKDEICTQFTMKPIEKLGLLKMDFLGVNTLNDIQSCLTLIENRTGEVIDPYDFNQVPINNPDVFSEFCKGNTQSTFQFHTKIATNLCKSIKPTCLEDLSAITANGRPGAMYALMEDNQTTLVESWIKRRNDKTEIEYLHPSFENILKETDGIFTYQEQLMAAFQESCGYTEEEADEIREVIGKKDKEQMDRIIPQIRESLANGGWNASKIESFVSTCRAAAGYSFNNSHSYCYAYLGYICGWLKLNYPLEWWTSVMQNSSADDIKVNANQCQDLVIPPDVNLSDMEFYIIDGHRDKIMYPLKMVKGVKEAGDSVIKCRPFSSMEDFYNKVDKRKVHKGVVNALIWAGGFDSMYNVQCKTERNQIYSDYNALRKEKNEEEPRDLTLMEILIKQNQALPMNSADFSQMITNQTGVKIDSYKEALLKHGTSLIAGEIVTVYIHTAKKKGSLPMCFLKLTNKSESADITVFNQTYQEEKSKLKEGAVVTVEVKVNSYKGELGFVANKITVYEE